MLDPHNHNHNHNHNIINHQKAETDQARAAEAAKLEEGMRVFNKFLERHGHPEGPFFFGVGADAYCLGTYAHVRLSMFVPTPIHPTEKMTINTHPTSSGEVCLAPFVQRLLVVLPHWCQIDPLALADRLGCARLRRWMEALAARPSTVASGGTKEETIQNYGRLLERMKAAKRAAAASK